MIVEKDLWGCYYTATIDEEGEITYVHADGDITGFFTDTYHSDILREEFLQQWEEDIENLKIQEAEARLQEIREAGL